MAVGGSAAWAVERDCFAQTSSGPTDGEGKVLDAWYGIEKDDEHITEYLRRFGPD
ncbi:MAG: hypothetical protein JW952_05670 [Candidatus Eisenbacteria bacterium]|nr:hypothetical protein [Candidatus Eisenbacteria bacterium]